MAERPPLESFYSAPQSRPPLESFYGEPSTPVQEPGLESGVTGHLKSLARSVAQLPPARIPDWMPLIGGYQPSVTNMAKGVYEGAKSAVTLPGDVYSGKVDPLSDEGIKRGVDFATTVALPAPKQISLAQRAAPLPLQEVKAAASEGYAAVTNQGRAIPFNGRFAPDSVRAAIEAQQGPRAARAPEVYAEIKTLGKAKDVGDLVDVRQNLKTHLGVEGPNKVAAALAMTEVDNLIERAAPNIMPTLQKADANWGAFKRTESVEDLYKMAEKGGTRGRPMGTRLQETFRPFYKNEGAQMGFKPIEKEALAGVAQPGMGVGLLRTGAALDPFTSALGPMIVGATSLHSPWALASIPVGIVSRLAYDRTMKNRARDVAELLLSRAPASMEATGPQRVLRLPGVPVKNPLIGYGNQ